MALSDRERKQIVGLVGVLAIAGAAAFWLYWKQPADERLTALEENLENLENEVERAKRMLARGDIGDLRAEVASYEAGLGLMRTLVPSESEVTDLLDEISVRAALRGVEIRNFDPEPGGGVGSGGQFQERWIAFTVVGEFDDLGDFLTDVASLPRIMVPQEVGLTRSGGGSSADSTVAPLEANFRVRTFVKSTAGGTGDESQ
ncbi:MAG TPA: type 4a pilus biogenesis protein PilO [Gemmatimonadales bacterium]|jgi:type IV pilus assembly protein PilO